MLLPMAQRALPTTNNSVARAATADPDDRAIPERSSLNYFSVTSAGDRAPPHDRWLVRKSILINISCILGFVIPFFIA